MTSVSSCRTTYCFISGVISPRAWYGTCSMSDGRSYSSRSSSNHFMNVKQPVYESSRRSGVGSGSPVGPMLPPRSIPMSHFTYVQTSSEWPIRSASVM